MRRRHAQLLRTLGITLVVGWILFLIVTLVTGPWVSSPLQGACGRFGGVAVGFPKPFYWQCYGLPLASGGSMVYSPVWDGMAFAFDYIAWYLAAVALVCLRYWPLADQRPFISSSGILPPLASSSDDIGLIPRRDGSPTPTWTEERNKRKAKE